MKITRIALTAYVFALLIIVLDQLSKADANTGAGKEKAASGEGA